MNSCDYYQELISRLIDGEISREEHEALMAHMNTCSRCNAMYAVFHDLSDILSEEPEPLPEGLHENIMAGVRRSEIIKKNRRLRTFGLRMALSAAACALLVLFAASGFGPGKRAADVSLRTQEAAEQLYQATQAPTVESLPAPTENVFTLSVQTAAPTPVWTAPAETPTTYASTDVRLAAGNSVNETYNTLQPEQYNPYQDDRYAAQVTAQTPAPAQYYEPYTAAQTPAPIVVQTPAPAVVQAPAPAVVQTPAPAVAQTPEPEALQAPAPAALQATNPEALQMSAPVEAQTSVELQAPVSVPEQSLASVQEQVTEPAVLENAEVPMLRMTAPAPAVSQDEALASTEIDVSETVVELAPFSMRSNAPELLESKTSVPEAGEDVNLMLFSGLASDQPDEEKGETMDAENAVQLRKPAESGVPELRTANLTPDAAAPMPEEIEEKIEEKIEELPAATPEKKAEEHNAKIYGKGGRDRLFALLGGSESELPAEAELTRVVHVTLVPDDAYGGEEKMDISIYGDFVYYSLYPAGGAAKSCRAACALRDLDSLLRELTTQSATASEPAPTPTIDPYAVETQK